MKQFNISRAIIAGIVATAAMTAMMFMAPMMGMPKMDVAAMLSGFMGVPVVVGWLAHFMVGVSFAVLYSIGFGSALSGSPSWLRGSAFALIPWFMAQVMVNPMMGAGFFASATPAPVMMVMGSLLGHLVFGAVLGAVYGAARQPSVAASH